VTLRAPFDRIAIEPGKMGGKPCIRGLRISVQNVLHIIATAALNTRAECRTLRSSKESS
jgi:uncharacterized protein (DUF433 family)